MANIFHAGCVILKMSVYSLVIARAYDKGIRDAQSRNAKMNLLYVIKKINSLESVGMECRCQNRRISGRGSRTVRLGGW